MIKIVLSLFLVFLATSARSAESKGIVCLGKNLAVTAQEQSARLYIRIDDSEKHFFAKPYKDPVVIAQNLDTNSSHTVRVYFDERLAQSWRISFKRNKSAGVLLWRSAGSWRTERIDPKRCVSGA